MNRRLPVEVADLDLEVAVLVGISTTDLVERVRDLIVDDFHGENVGYFLALRHLAGSTGIRRETIIRIGDEPTDTATALERLREDPSLELDVAIEVVGFEDALALIGSRDPVNARRRFFTLPHPESAGGDERIDRLVEMRVRRQELGTQVAAFETALARYRAGDSEALADLENLLGRSA